MMTKEQKEALQLLIRLYADEVSRASVGKVSNPAEQAEAINLFLDEITVLEGWQVVPVEPTREMIEAARQHHEGEAYLPFSLYKAMLAAAPKLGDSNE